ncbi:hypothetical protein Lal_00017487, partial [Lupinus albus]
PRTKLGIHNDIAYNFYKIYALKKRFDIRKYHTRRDKDGFRDNKNDLFWKRALRKATRCSCLARMKIHIDKEKMIDM